MMLNPPESYQNMSDHTCEVLMGGLLVSDKRTTRKVFCGKPSLRAKATHFRIFPSGRCGQLCTRCEGKG